MNSNFPITNFGCQRREVSSPSLTFYHRFLFPAFFTGLSGLIMVSVLCRQPRGQDQEPLSLFIKLLAITAWLLVAALVFWVLSGYRRVWIDESYLVVDSGFRRIEVPFANITGVAQGLIATQNIKIRLRKSTPFGQEIVFIPEGPHYYCPQHPVVMELRASIARWQTKQDKHGTPSEIALL